MTCIKHVARQVCSTSIHNLLEIGKVNFLEKVCVKSLKAQMSYRKIVLLENEHA
jgi:hypothetical protein